MVFLLIRKLLPGKSSGVLAYSSVEGVVREGSPIKIFTFISFSQSQVRQLVEKHGTVGSSLELRKGRRVKPNRKGAR